MNISENIAVGYNNVIINDNLSSMKAQKITMNMITKDIKINSNDRSKLKPINGSDKKFRIKNYKTADPIIELKNISVL